MTYSFVVYGIVEVYHAQTLTSGKRKKILRVSFLISLTLLTVTTILGYLDIPKFECGDKFCKKKSLKNLLLII